MHIVAFILALVAAVLFVVAAVMERRITSAMLARLALAAVTVAWIVQTCLLSGTHIVGR